MRRREFITLLGGAAAAWPVAARGQQSGRTYRLGILIPAPREEAAVAAMFDELRLSGFVEGQNLMVIPGGFGIGNGPRELAERAAALVKAAPDAIVAGYPHALLAATKTIPLIGMAEDMVAEGLVASLARPGGNMTGISILSLALNGKRQGLLLETAPKARRIAAMYDSTNTTSAHIQELQSSAGQRGVEVLSFAVARPDDIVPAINAAKSAGVEAFNFLATPLFSRNSSVVFKRVAELRLPAVYQWPEQAEDGGMMAYGARITSVFRQRARLVAKALRGIKPADIPVEQPTTFELVVNLKTAQAIGFEIPATLVLRADKVIQ